VVYAEPGKPGAYQAARKRLAQLLARLRAPVAIPADTRGASEPAVSGFGQSAYHAAVERAKRYIFEGDIMQVVPSQRMVKPFRATPLALYRALRTINPSPYMYYFDMGDFHVVGASPEILARLEGETVTVRPIAGTRRRGATPTEDAALEKELLADEKERAEHIMLVDLGRNDVGRVARTGSVRVTEQMVVERYSHVMHIVSNVEGRLKPGLNAVDVLRATFPAGTVSGAPKVRAMEIIDELEPVKRGIYAGAVGYLGFHGTWTSPSRCARPWFETARSTCRRAAASWPTRSRRRSGRRPRARRRPCCERRNGPSPVSTPGSTEGASCCS